MIVAVGGVPAQVSVLHAEGHTPTRLAVNEPGQRSPEPLDGHGVVGISGDHFVRTFEPHGSVIAPVDQVLDPVSDHAGVHSLSGVDTAGP